MPSTLLLNQGQGTRKDCDDSAPRRYPLRNLGLAEECQQLYHQTDSLLTKSLKLQLQLFNFREVSRLCRHFQQFSQQAGLHARGPSLLQTIDYLDQVFRYMGNLNVEYSFTDSASSNLSGKIQLKLQQLLKV